MSAASTALAEGDLIDGKYRIVRFLGRGAWASVYEGLNVRIGRRVAIKVLSDEAVQKPGITDRFEREAQAATRIESDHVVGVFDLGQLGDGRPYIVMELLEGEDLARRIQKRGAVSQDRAVHYVVQALRGLADAHAAGVMHRDIKPDNVVLVRTKSGEEIVKIVDFGISKLAAGAKVSNNMTQTNAVLGSPAYMSPEQCRGAKHMDHRSDLYSIGVVLYELITGQLPHKAETFNELMFQIALEDVKSPALVKPELDADLCKLVLKSLAREPGDRYQTAQEFETALLEWAKARGHHTDSWIGRRSRGFLRVTIDDNAKLTGTTERPPPPEDPVVEAREISDTTRSGEKITDSGVKDSGERKEKDLTATTGAPVSSASSSSAKELKPPRDGKKTAMYAALGTLFVLGAGGAIWAAAHGANSNATGLVPSATTTATHEPATATATIATATATATETAAVTATETASTDAADAGAKTAATHKPPVVARPNTATTTVAATAPPPATTAPPTTPSGPASAKSVVDGRTIRTNF